MSNLPTSVKILGKRWQVYASPRTGWVVLTRNGRKEYAEALFENGTWEDMRSGLINPTPMQIDCAYNDAFHEAVAKAKRWMKESGA